MASTYFLLNNGAYVPDYMLLTAQKTAYISQYKVMQIKSHCNDMISVVKYRKEHDFLIMTTSNNKQVQTQKFSLGGLSMRLYKISVQF
jgi:hypothetical protein